jgi:hypothetical protein
VEEAAVARECRKLPFDPTATSVTTDTGVEKYGALIRSNVFVARELPKKGDLPIA